MERVLKSNVNKLSTVQIANSQKKKLFPPKNLV